MEKKEELKISKKSFITKQENINDTYTIIDRVWLAAVSPIARQSVAEISG